MPLNKETKRNQNQMYQSFINFNNALQNWKEYYEILFNNIF